MIVARASATTMPGQRARHVVGRLERPAGGDGEADDEDGQRERQDDRDDRAADAAAASSGRVPRRGGRRPRPRPAEPEPAHDAEHRHADRQRRRRRARADAAGSVARPERDRGDAGRGAPGPDPRIAAVAARGMFSNSSRTRQHSTRTLASDAAAGPLKVERYWTMIAVVNVSNRTIAKAPYSASRWSPTSSAPPRIGSRSCGSTTPTNTCRGLAAEARRDLLERRIEPPEDGHDRQVDERVVGKGRDEDAGRQPGQRRHDSDPAVARDEGRDDERRGQQDRPHAAPGHVRALDEPGRRRPRRRRRPGSPGRAARAC